MKFEDNKYVFPEDNTFEGFEEDFEGFPDPEAQSAVEEINELFANLPANSAKSLTREAVAEWVGIDANLPGWQDLTDEELIESVRNPEKEKEIPDDDEEEVKNKQTWKEAVHHLEKFIDFAESHAAFSSAKVMQLHILLEETYKMRQQHIKQADIRDMFNRAAENIQKKNNPKEEENEPPNKRPRLDEAPVPVPEPMPGPSRLLTEDDMPLDIDDPTPTAQSDSDSN
ncbi:hypothetical protein Pmani_032404 [Petrolisthes manimaculis]|uniref:Uncharacterized protein n=1 Tax=Petrolisthes manimaculis TaxID=1843537 RepID=A0AAE1TRG8_9EUCA|nr:hypothetical protein Pmani_032404 [Petrolisthes manimaculis]